jgi:aspartyl-tRNA(Asn)/glutamyl-tRNA(Gln) amidotransferase subunit A
MTRDRLEEALGRIADPNGEGARACLTVYTDAARAAADAADARARAGLSLGPLDGTIVSSRMRLRPRPTHRWSIGFVLQAA